MGAAQRLDVAEALIAKARATPYSAERTAFAAGAAEQLSAFLRSEGPHGGAGTPQPRSNAEPQPQPDRQSQAARYPRKAALGRAEAPGHGRRLSAAWSAYRSLKSTGPTGQVIDLTL